MWATGDSGLGDRGATLLEMLVVVAIMGLIAGLVFPGFTGSIRSASLAQAAERLDGDLWVARADAARQGHATVVELTPDGRGYAGPRGIVRLPAPLRIVGDPRTIQFFADGSAAGATWTMANGRRSSRESVDDTTGLPVARAP